MAAPKPDNTHYGTGVEQLTALVVDGATDGRAQMVALGVALAGYEDCLHGDSWRNTSQANARYFAFLTANGYELSDVERLAGSMTGDTSPASATGAMDPFTVAPVPTTRVAPSGSYSAVVYAGTDPLTGKPRRLRETVKTVHERSNRQLEQHRMFIPPYGVATATTQGTSS